ncbi:MAG TPA: 3-hydroxybutyryl-CoA dehydrogenase [Burkholderiales bacterium]|nr:3-hydroxybutyryl-CoA dehydrogenase [Burkholderiales bacterium]
MTLSVIASLGAGRMGRGIAHAFAYGGHDVLLVDLKERAPEAARKLAEEARAEVDASLAMLASLGAFDDAVRPGVLARIRCVARADAPAALARADVVFEGVPEVLDAKRAAFEWACAHLRADAIVASTTSTMLSTQLAGFVTHPERFLNAHWLNPAYLVPLVELSPHPGTAPAIVARMKALLEAIGKVPVLCAVAPGFIAPRMQALMMNEAARMIEQGVASAEDIDRAVRYGLGFRYANMGVVEFIDVGGLDILYYASRYLAESTGDARYASPEIVNRYMREGHDGLRAGRGFYDWKAIDVPAYRRDALGRQLALLKQLGMLKPPGAAQRD